MAEKEGEGEKKDKVQKLVRILKELEEKYKKVCKDRTGLLQVVQAITPSDLHTRFQFDFAPGDFEPRELAKVYVDETRKWIEAGKAKATAPLVSEIEVLREKNRALEEEKQSQKAADAALRLRLNEVESKLRQLESEKTKEAQERAKTEGTLLLSKLRQAAQPSGPPRSILASKESKDRHEGKQAVPALETDLKHNSPQGTREAKKSVHCGTQTDKVVGNLTISEEVQESMLGQKQERIQDTRIEYKALEEEYQNCRKKAQLLLAEKEGEIEGLKETVKSLKRQMGSQDPPMGDKRTRSGAALPQALAETQRAEGPSSLSRVQLLEKKVEELTAVLQLHRLTEQDLSKRVRHYELTKTKEDINYEYFKNAFLKYLVFVAQNSPINAAQLEGLLFDILHVNKQEREHLALIRSSTASIWRLFSWGTAAEPSTSALNMSTFVPTVGLDNEALGSTTAKHSKQKSDLADPAVKPSTESTKK